MHYHKKIYFQDVLSRTPRSTAHAIDYHTGTGKWLTPEPNILTIWPPCVSPKTFTKLFEWKDFTMGRSGYTRHEYFLFRPNEFSSYVF